MAVRTNTSAVQLVLGDEYGKKRDGTYPDLTPYIEAASAMVDDLVILCATKVPTPPVVIATGSAKAEVIERWLSAHFYQQADPAYQSRSTQGASGSFTGAKGNGFASTRFGETALRLDTSGCLALLDKRAVAGAFWLGKTRSEQTTYDDRNG